MKQLRIPAVYMRGGTSKGVFFHAHDLPTQPSERDQILLRVMGSPDPYGKQIDGMGGASSSTSKVVIIAKSTRPNCDVDYLFGQVSIANAVIDWSGNCGNLSSAVGPFAISEGLVKVPPNGLATVRIWQANIQKEIIAHVPMQDGEVLELGDFNLDGVTFPAAEVRLEFLDPGGDSGQESGPILPTGKPKDLLSVPHLGQFEVSYINAGLPTIFMQASALGLQGTELQADVNLNPELLHTIELIRSHGAVVMGLAKTPEEATSSRPHTPKLCFVAKPADYTSADGKLIESHQIHLLARVISMGVMHHAMTGTGAVAIAAAAAIPGNLVSDCMNQRQSNSVIFGHPSGILEVGAKAICTNKEWVVTQVNMSRTARRIMEGFVRIPKLSPLSK